MTSLDDATEDNEHLDAIRALMYEGTRAEIAEGFREQGNELAKMKKWGDGKELYTKGLVALRVKRKEGDPTGEGENGRERAVREACLVNRALCNLELSTYPNCYNPYYTRTGQLIDALENYRSTTLDCQSALALTPTNLKAHYRLTLALLSLSKLPLALTAAKTGLSHHPSNPSLLSLQQKITSQLAAADALAQKRLAEETRRKLEATTLLSALKLRKITTRTTPQPPDMEDASIALTPDPVSLKSTLTFPVILLYPLHLQSDFIKAFGEEQTLLGHLEYLLPLPWDEKEEYKPKEVEAYMETREGGLLKWGKKVPLLTVLSGGKVEVVDGIVRVNVLPKGRAGEWVEGVKKRRGKV